MYSYFDDPDAFYRKLVDNFNNNYTIENNLDIDVKMEVLSPGVSTSLVENYSATIYSLLSKHSQKYDVYYFYSAYAKKYGEYFADIRKYLPKEHLDLFDQEILENTCTSKGDILIGLPFVVHVFCLYSNKELLERYHKDIPKTWDELMETNFNGSNALFSFIDSFRNSKESPHPATR
eukprot:jgi/Orpsp1_1/1182411/evm.model.c7180000081171.1